MASKSDPHNVATANQVATDFFQSWAVAEDANDVLTKDWVVAESDDRNPFYALYPNPTKAVIAQVASILKSSTSPEVVVGNKSYSRDMAIEWLITHASRIPAIRDAVQNPKIDEYSLLELIEEVYCDTQARSLAPEVREQLVENLMAANDQKAKQSQDATGRTRLPTDHDLIELAKRNALIAYYKTTTIDPVAQNITQSSQRLTEQANQNPQFAATLQTDAQIAAQSAAILTNTLTVNDFRTVPVEKTVEVITQQALAGTSLQNNPDAKKVLENTVRQQYQQRQQQVEQIHVSTQALAQELTTTANLTPQQSQQAAARFGEMVAAASTVQTKLDTVHTSRLLDQAVADVKAGATQTVTPVKVQTVLEGGAKVIASPAISFSPDIKTAVQQVVHSQQAVTQSENVQKATLHAAQTIAQDLVDSEAIRPDQLTKVVNRYQEALQTATANGVTINPVQARQLLDQARIDVEEGKTTTPITQTQVNAVLQTSVPQAAPILSSQSQSALDQLIQVHQQSKSEQLKVALEAKQSLTTHLINQGQVTVTEAPLVTQHYERLLQAAQALSPTPLSAQQTENLLGVAVEHVKSGQAPLETAQAVSTAQIGKINEALKPSTPTQENMPAAAQAAATKMVQAHESALPATDYISAQVAVSHDEIAKFYKDYGVTDVEAASHVAKVKELVSQGYTVQDAVLKAGGQDFEQRVQDSFNSHEELNEFVQRVDGLKPYVKTPDIDIYVGDKRLVIDRFRFKSSSETISFDKALESINQVRLASGQGAITQRQLKLALIHQDTFQKLIADNPHLAGTIEQISADSTQIREFLRNNKDILQIKDGELLSQLVHDDNLIRFNPERGFNLFKSRVSGTIHEFNREARSIIDELKARITGKGVTTPIPEITDGEKPTAAPGQKLPAAKHSADTQPSTEMDTHLTDEYGNQVPLTGFRRILYPFKRFFQRLRASFFKTIGNWSQMGGVRGFVGRGVSWTLGKLGVKGFANNFVKGAASKVAKKVASKLAGKAAEKALGKLVGLLGPWGKVASVIIGLVGMENVKKILGAVAGLAGLIALAPLLWAAGVINAASAAVSKGVTAIKGAVQSVLSGSSAAGGLTPAIANAPIIAVGATAVAGIFTMQQLSAVFMLPPYGTSNAFFNNQENLSSYSCPNENIPSSFPTGSPVEGSGWPITAGLNTSTGKSQHHNAVDIAPPLGTRVIATVDGYVLFAGWNNQGYGNLVILRSSDNAFTVYYAHLTNVFVQVNDTVVKNQTVIGSVGHTGNVIGGNGGDGTHLHYELRSSLYPNISLACGLGLSPEQVETLNGGCLSNCGTMP